MKNSRFELDAGKLLGFRLATAKRDHAEVPAGAQAGQKLVPGSSIHSGLGAKIGAKIGQKP